MCSALRVRAPGLQPSDELRWVLLRAFGPLNALAPRVLAPAKVVALSRDLDLASRIAVRHAALLAEELGAEPAREFGFDRLRVIAMDRLLSNLSQEILQTAQQFGSPVIWLKHAALRRLGLIAEGERAARDVDLLVPETSATRLQEALAERGFRASSAASELHLPPLQRAPGEVVEIHTTLWGMALPDFANTATGATAETIIAAGLVEDLGDSSYTPSKAMLAAHAVTHGLIQHRTSPEGYPIMRALSDLCSLGSLDAQECLAFAAHPPASALIAAALRLSAALRSGEDVLALPPRSPEFQLLSHLVAASVDPLYRRALRFERVFELVRPEALRGSLRSAFSVTDSGPPDGSGNAPPLRLSGIARAVTLALELARGATSYSALRFRRRPR